MSTYLGPAFTMVESISMEELVNSGGLNDSKKPLLVKGAVKNWPAWHKWSFEMIANLRNKNGSEIIGRFQNGLIEQGKTKKPLYLPIAPYLYNLEDQASKIQKSNQENIGLLPLNQSKNMDPKSPFHLNWDYLKSFPANMPYLAQWHLLKKFPEFKRDFEIQQLWKGLRWTWEYVFMGPSHTVTGLHDDFGNNWFCQIRGLKEFILFTPDENDAYLSESDKYDWGARLSKVDITKIEQQEERKLFEKAKGLYARVEAGDALYIPKRTWHGVVALEPSISIAVFGLTMKEILTEGLYEEAKSLAHHLGLHHRNNCACHVMTESTKKHTLATL